MPSLGVDSNQFTLAGHPANEGHHLRGVSLSGVLLGIDVGDARMVSGFGEVLRRAADSGLNAISVGLTPASELDHDEASDSSLAETLAMVAKSGLAPFIRVGTPRAAWCSIRAEVQTARDPSQLSRDFAQACESVASIMPTYFAIVIDLPPGPLSHVEVTNSLIAAVRDGVDGRALVGIRHVSPIREPNATPDFVFAPRYRHDRLPDESRAGSDLTLPLVQLGDGTDLDDPDGGLARAVRHGASWFLRMGRPSDLTTELGAPFDAFLETVRAARAAGRAPSDHPTVARADLRHLFRRHAGDVRALNLIPANAPGNTPR